MTQQPGFSACAEPSFADLIVAISEDADLTPVRKTHWTCSVRQIAKGLGRPLELLPARLTAVRHGLDALHHEHLGITAKSLANHKANLRAALAWFSRAADVPSRGVPLTGDWAALLKRLGGGLHRKRLLAFMRFCSAMGVGPHDVGDDTVDRFLAYRQAATRLKSGTAARRALARSWNAAIGGVQGWPETRLVEPPSAQKGLSLEDLPNRLRAEISVYLDSLTRLRRTRRGKRLRPCKPSTIRTRRAELMAYIRMAIACGFLLDDTTSLATLLHPDVAEKVLDAYWRKDGETPSVYTIDLAWKLVSVARETGCLGFSEIERLDELRVSLQEHRQGGLTEKNRALIRQVLVEEVWRSVLCVPEVLMGLAVRQHAHAPVRAGVLAGIAVAIRILSVAPIRIGNLAAIRIGENLIRPAGPNGPWWIVFPDYDVKNRIPLEFELDEATSRLIDRYLADFRSPLTRGAQNDWLFPGEDANHKGAATLSRQISARVHKATGVALTAHQFRHAAAAIFLKHRPGEYELVRRLLGHRSITTTTRFYAGLESLQATRIFGDIITSELKARLGEGDGGPPEDRDGRPRGSKSRRRG